MRVLFLDFDGVVNSIDWMRRRQKLTEDERMAFYLRPKTEAWALHSIDPDAVKVVNELVSKLDARVVISSSWRTMYPLNRLEEFLRYHGFTHHLLGATPELTEVIPGHQVYAGVARSREIEAWLRMLPEGLVGPRDYLAIDDEEFASYQGRIYQTSYDYGLRAQDVERILELFA